MLYWACYLGLTDVVSYILKLGYSPFQRVNLKRNALMGAIKAGQLATVELIVSLSYVPSDA
jgi:ankyrin repeat protein